MNDEDGETRPDARQGFEKKDVRADANDAAEKEKRKGIAGSALAARVGIGAEENGGEGETPEIGLRAAQDAGGPRGAHDREGPHYSCQQGWQHGRDH